MKEHRIRIVFPTSERETREGRREVTVQDNRRRLVIENVKPEIDCGRFPIRRVAGERVVVTADIFADGHDALSARVLYKKHGEEKWREAPMGLVDNDRWKGEFIVEEIGVYHYLIEGWIDHFKTWQRDFQKRWEALRAGGSLSGPEAGESLKADLRTGARYVEEASGRASEQDREKLDRYVKVLKKGENGEDAVAIALGEELTESMDRYPDREFAVSYEKELAVMVDRERALFSSWYELFPRSCSPEPGKYGTFKDCKRLLPEIAKMRFDILYLPPIHPIGKTNRKGKNNILDLQLDDVGSPWAIGSEEGGHKAIDPRLGTLEDFESLVNQAKKDGIEIAMDLAFQCSPDHPYTKEHPEWFRWRPDGTIQYAENPPKKYEDIVPFNFEAEAWGALWEELKSIVLFWIEKGIRIFRVDNPHTKPFAFWKWLIEEVKQDYPDVIFIAEAFTRPKVMYRLAKAGFTQSYTYFTWRNTKRELKDYLTELTQTEVREYFRPNFWPNTPDILPEYLQYGGTPAFVVRLVLAATLASNYGIYGPAFELCINQALPGKEEYLNSEKYQLRHWDWDKAQNLRGLIAKVNQIRKENPALHGMSNLSFYEVNNDSLIFYGKATDDLSNLILVAVNLDPFHTQSGWVKVPLDLLGIDSTQPYLVHDLLGEGKYIWQGEKNFVEVNPKILPAKIFKVRKRLRREMDFDYFM